MIESISINISTCFGLPKENMILSLKFTVNEGALVGLEVGSFVGAAVGTPVGNAVGEVVGDAVG